MLWFYFSYKYYLIILLFKDCICTYHTLWFCYLYSYIVILKFILVLLFVMILLLYVYQIAILQIKSVIMVYCCFTTLIHILLF